MFQYGEVNLIPHTESWYWALNRLMQRRDSITIEYLTSDYSTIGGFEELEQLSSDIDFLLQIRADDQLSEELLNLKSIIGARWLEEFRVKANELKNNMKWYTSIYSFKLDNGISFFDGENPSKYLSEEHNQELKTIVEELNERRNRLEDIAIAEAQYYTYSDLLRNPPYYGDKTQTKIECLGEVAEESVEGFIIETGSLGNNKYSGDLIKARTYSNPLKIIAGDIIEIVGTYEFLSTYEEIGEKPTKIPLASVDTVKIIKARE